MPSHASSTIAKVLVANRGEIAVRVIRAAKDAGLPSVAVYAEPDADAPHVKLADEAFALGGQTSAESYLDFGKLLEAAEKSGANAIHPGYGFLSENADFAQAVIDAGLIWIGPSPQSIRDLGDKVTARHIAARAQAPLVPGTPDPVKDADEVVAFAKEYGVPIAIKAAFGGGGRGMKVARTLEEIPELFESATREAVAAFGRGECFVERYLDKPRHVEAQVIADQHGNVVVAGTRDCSLQRRFQKLVEEAPAPFLTDAQRKEIHESAKRICKEAHYYGAGTVEYLVGQDGLISFLEVNTRLQVEHPVTEETAGIDLVLQQFKIANGDKLDITEDPTPRGHAIEFRINGEDAGRGFLPAPGPVTRYDIPTGPGVRLDSGVEAGSVIGGQFDSMLSKLIVYGANRDEALRGRAARLLSSTSKGWLPSSRSTAPWCPTRRSSATTTASRCTPAGSRPSGTTPSSPSPAASRLTKTSLGRGRKSWWRSAPSHVLDRMGQHRPGADRRRRKPGGRSGLMSMPAPLAEVVSDFAEVQGQDKLKLLLEFANELPALPSYLEEAAMEPVLECQSPLFLHVDASDVNRVRLHFSAPAEAPTTRGFASILAAGLDEQPAADILAVPEDFYTELGLAMLVSPLRLRGMSAMLARIKRRLRESG